MEKKKVILWSMYQTQLQRSALPLPCCCLFARGSLMSIVKLMPVNQVEVQLLTLSS